MAHTRYKGGSVRSLLVRVAEWIIDLEGEPVLFETPLPQNLTARKARGGTKSNVVRPAECRSQTKQSGHGKILVVATRKVIFRPTGQTCRYKVGPSFRAIEQKRCEFRGQNLEDPPRRTHLFADDSKAPCGCVYLRLQFQEQILRSRYLTLTIHGWEEGDAFEANRA